jgi:predicted CxxxxCH...CXXCH cytochrome family protein
VRDTLVRKAMSCSECHVVPAQSLHSNGTVDMSWGPLATSGGAAPVFTASSATCASTYCHGATLNAGGETTVPTWTKVDGSQGKCASCHGYPPSAPHPQNGMCNACHPLTVTVDGSIDVAGGRHIDGTVDVAGMTCSSCHGDATKQATSQDPRYAAPPVDTAGDSVSSHVGAHPIHLDGSALGAPVTCNQCHTVPQSLSGHPSGTVELTWGSLATGALSASISVTSGFRSFSSFSTKSPSYAGGTCSSTYCHGSYSGSYTYPILMSDPVELQTITYAGNAAAPTWTGTAACGSCHGAPPDDANVWHSGVHGGGNDCSLCHPDAVGTATSAMITNPALHVDGKIDLAPQFDGFCFGCH